MKHTLPKYKRNLHLEDGGVVVSYTTHVATIDSTNRKLYVHGHWSMTTSKHINYVADYYHLIKEDKRIDEPQNDLSELRTVAMVAKFGDILAGDNKKEKNDWKVRMLKAGLENKGLVMPEDWDTLSEEEKERRLNGAIAQIA